MFTRLNDPYDPTGTVGTDQPDGFDRWCAASGGGLYRNFMVYGARYSITCQNRAANNSIRLALYTCDAGETAVTQKWDDIKDSQRLHKTCIIPGTAMGNSKSTTRTLSMYCSIAKASSDSKALTDTTGYSGYYGGSPTNLYYFKTMFDTWRTGIVDADVFYTIQYYIKFFNAPFVNDDVAPPASGAETFINVAF